MASPLSTEYPTAGELNSNCLDSSLSDIPNSSTAQKQKRLLAFTFSGCLPFEKTSSCVLSPESSHNEEPRERLLTQSMGLSVIFGLYSLTEKTVQRKCLVLVSTGNHIS
jgi:hypothetical protein